MSLRRDLSRRLFLQQASAYGSLLGRAAPLGLQLAGLGAAAAQASPLQGGPGSDYRALVCIFLYGGNDAYNTVLQTDRTSFGAYRATRGQGPDSIALPPVGVAPNPLAPPGSPARLGGARLLLGPGGVSRTVPLAVHPLLATLPPLHAARRLAVLNNIGPLRLPTTKAQAADPRHPLPARLFSHNDQQNTWLTGAPEGTTRGWGGRLADQLQALNGQPVFTAVSASGNAVWLAGSSVRPYQVGQQGAIRLGLNASGQLFDSAVAGAALQRLVSQARRADPLDADVAAVGARSIAAEALLRNALRPASDPAFGTPPAGGSYQPQADPRLLYADPLADAPAYNPLAAQLQVVARLIDAGLRGAVGVRRQVFFVSLGGFDTHSNQNRVHARLMAQLSHALGYFDDVIGGLGALAQVTSFTASDFGRSFTSNGDGTDHGWGGHQFVLGGAVRGGRGYGLLPRLAPKNPGDNGFDASPDLLANGVLLPTTSVDQLGFTLGRWFGVSDSALLDVFPDLLNFDASVRDLGFMAP